MRPPAWVGWLSAAGAVAHAVGWFGVVVESGPLAPGGWFTYVPYALWMIWLVVVTAIMVARLRGPASTPPPQSTQRLARAGPR